MAIPEFTESEIQRALEHIDTHGVPASRHSMRYFLVANGKEYPPKYVLSVAGLVRNGNELDPFKFNAVSAKDYLLRRGYRIRDAQGSTAPDAIAAEDDELAFPEGRTRYQLHRSRERSTEIPKRAKEERLAREGKLECDVCGFDFRAAYGLHGEGYIEAHHNVPVSELHEGEKTKLKDISLVCSNCHRMLHRAKPWLTVAELKVMLRNNAAQRRGSA
ncbi:MAG: HNH endonuclease [Gammaproteobacteria bacterium]